MMIFINPFSNLDDHNRDMFLSMIALFRKEYGLKHLFIISDDEPHLEKLNPKKILMLNKKLVDEEQRIVA